MKYLVVGDIHVKTGNIPEILELRDAILKHSSGHNTVDATRTAHERPVDAIVLLGDVLDYHEKVLTPCLNTAYTLISDISKHFPVYVLVGNHDYISNSQFLTNAHWMNAMKRWSNVTVVDSVIAVDGATFCPYVPPGRLQEALGSCREHTASNVIFCHQEFRGCDMGAVRSETGDGYDGISLAVSGHIHDNQWLSDIVYYVGAPLQHAFGDKDKRVLAVVDTSTKSVTEIPLTIGKKITISVDCDRFSELTLDEIPKDASVRVILQGTLTECKALKKSVLYKKLAKKAKVVFHTTKESEDKNHVAHKTSFLDHVQARLVSDPEVADLFQKILPKQ
jgi:DNA repair exonuclease SbcCD nuclease subunit